MKDKKLDKLIREISGRSQQKNRRERFVDPTIRATTRPEEKADQDTRELFKEMKRREF